MKKLKWIGLLLMFFSAADVYADAGDQYLLTKLGIMDVKLNGGADPLRSIGIMYGYGVTPEISAEAELNAGISGGAYDYVEDSGTRRVGEYRVYTIAGYGVYRFPISPGAYLKAKLGLLIERVINDGREGGDKLDIEDGGGVAGGLGAGFVVGESLITEAEITGIDEDIIFYSLGLHYSF